MLPWKINRNSKKTMTYRPEVPMALYEILPEKYSYKSKDEQRSSYCLEVNRGRLKADPYRFLAHLIGKYEVESEWRKRLSERRLGPKYRKVQRAYKIKRSTVTSGDDPVWEARLMTKDPGFPLEFEVRLPLSRLKQKPIENFVSWLNKKKKTIRSIPWLKKALMEQPSEVGRISIIHSSRHDPKETFLDKLENLNLSELKSKLKPKMEQAIFFKISHPNPLTDRNLNEIETHWVLFSDGQLILYRLWSVYTRVTVKDLISLKASFLEPIQEMKTFNAYFVAVVNPDGTLSAIYKK